VTATLTRPTIGMQAHRHVVSALRATNRHRLNE
jgi:hypothetical protein